MKLFKSLLVAPATLGLLAPIAATANEVTISDFTTAEQIAVTNSRVDGLEARLNNIEAGSFSETTTASFKTDFAIGSVDGLGSTTALPDGNQTLQAVYGFQIDLNTSFTGEDSLDISIDAGNGAATGPLGEYDLNGGADALTVDGVAYTFPLGGFTAVVGDNTDGSKLFTKACVYGTPSNTLDDCGNVNAAITNGGAMAGLSRDFGGGFTVAVGYAGNEADIMTKEGIDAYGANAAYIADNYGVSLTYGTLETSTTDETSYTALNGYYSFESGVNVSAGYEVGEIGGANSDADQSINYFLGVNGDVGPGELGAAYGTHGGQVEGQEEELMYEVYYSYALNDGMTVTPLFFIKEKASALEPDQTGVMVKTTFKF